MCVSVCVLLRGVFVARATDFLWRMGCFLLNQVVGGEKLQGLHEFNADKARRRTWVRFQQRILVVSHDTFL